MTVKAITLYQENLPTPNYFHIHNTTDTLENGALKANESIAVVEIGRKSTTVGNGHQLVRGDPTTVVYATSLPTPTSPTPTSKPKKVDGKILNSSSEQHLVKVNADPKQENVPSYVFYSNVRKQQPQQQVAIEPKPPLRNNSIFAYLAEKRRNQQTIKGNSRPTGLVMTRPSQNPRYRTVENVLPLNHKPEKYQSTEHQPEVIDPNEQKISSQSQLPPPPYLHYHTANAFMRPPPFPPYPMRNNFPIHPMTVTDFEKILNLLTIRYLLKRKIFDYRRMYDPHSPYEPPYYHQQRHNPYLPLGSERFEQQQQQQQQQSQNQPPESENQPIGYNEQPYRRNSALPADVREQLLYRLLMLTSEYDPVVNFEQQSANIPQNHNPSYDYYNSNYGQSFPLPQSQNPLPLTGPGGGPVQPNNNNNNIYYAASSSNNHNTNHYGNGSNKPVRSVQILGEEAR